MIECNETLVILSFDMSGSPFIPKSYQGEPRAGFQTLVPEYRSEQTTQAYQPPKASGTNTSDRIGSMMLKAQRYLVVALVFLLPIFFVPGLPASLGFDKAILATICGVVVVMLAALSSLRYTETKTVLPYALFTYWAFVTIAFLSAFLSGDIQDAVRGSYFEPQTAGFFAVMGLVMTLPLIFQRDKTASLKILVALGGASTIALLYTLVRVFLKPGALAFKSFGSVTVSPVGAFNDMAVFAGLAIIISLITLLQLPLKKMFQVALAVLTAASLVVMAVVNFFNLWIVVGFFAILLLVFIFSRDTLFNRVSETDTTTISPVTIGVTMLVCAVSILFVVAGDYLGARISNSTGVNYLEVRPSMSATIDIARQVYHGDIFLGVGPNKFVDAWRLYKDQSINNTIFWGTDFVAGFGLIPTLFITTGLLGGLAMLVFQGFLLYAGYRMLLRGNNTDSYWYYFGLVSFAGAAFLWGMSYVYVSGSTVLLLAALFTGFTFVAYQALVPEATKTLALVSSRRRGFFLMTIVIVVITGAVATLFTLGKQYVAQAEFSKARAATNIDEFNSNVGSAFEQYQDDMFAGAIAQIRLAEMRGMLGLKDPKKEDQERFANVSRQAIAASEEAIRLDSSNPAHYATQAQILSVLAAVGYQDAENRANGRLEDARWRDPKNPSYDMVAAYMAVQLNDSNTAREKIKKALALKNNFSEALFLQAQLDVKDGNIKAAVETARQIITLEPDNPTRYYQLGVLMAADKNLEGAIEAYEAAIKLDNNFANARYMLALTYIDQKRVNDALDQLRIVQQSNQDNEQLNNLIKQLETGGLPLPTEGLEGSVNEATPGQNNNGDNVTSPTKPDTNLVSPVNNTGEENKTESNSNEATQ
jgi:tetratricopeptide (TPR) repeat protein